EQRLVIAVEPLARELLLEGQDAHEPLAVDEGNEEPEALLLEPLAELLAVGVGEVERDLLEVGGPALLAQHAPQRRRRRQAVFLAAAPLEPAVAVPEPDRSLLEPHGRRHACRQVVRDAPEIQLSRDRLAHLEECGLVVELLAEEELVERRLEPTAEHLEERDADEEEAEVEERRRRELRA